MFQVTYEGDRVDRSGIFGGRNKAPRLQDLKNVFGRPPMPELAQLANCESHLLDYRAELESLDQYDLARTSTYRAQATGRVGAGQDHGERAAAARVGTAAAHPGTRAHQEGDQRG